MKFNPTNISVSILLALLPLISCCAGREIRGAPSYPPRPRGASELRQILIERAENALPLKLKGRLTYWAGQDAKPRSCLALILADPSRKIRVKGYRRIGPTLFEAASDGHELLLYTYSTGEFTKPRDPGEETFYRRLLEGILESLFPPLVQEDEILLMECTPKYYILSVAGKGESGHFLKKKIWVNNESLHVDGVIHYDNRGIPLVMTTIRGYKEGEKGLPSRITILWPGDGALLEISIKSIEPAEKVPSGIFSLSDLRERS